MVVSVIIPFGHIFIHTHPSALLVLANGTQNAMCSVIVTLIYTDYGQKFLWTNTWHNQIICQTVCTCLREGIESCMVWCVLLSKDFSLYWRTDKAILFFYALRKKNTSALCFCTASTYCIGGLSMCSLICTGINLNISV